MPAATMYAVLTAVAMIGWNVAVTEGKLENPGRPYARPRSKRRFRRFGRRQRQQQQLQQKQRYNSNEKPTSSTEQVSSSSTSSPSSSTPTASSSSSSSSTDCASTPPRRLQRQQQHDRKDQAAREGEKDGAIATACRPCGTPVTAPTSVDRCPVSPATPANTPPCPSHAEFQDLVLILDAPAMPPPPWKLPNLPEEMVDASFTDNPMDPSPSLSPLSPSRGGCDLSPGFHLSAPWSPTGRRNTWGRNNGSGGGGGNSSRIHRRRSAPLGNRPRTFSEYSAAESSEGGGGAGSQATPPTPLLPERLARSASVGAGAGLWSATATATAAAWGEWRERRARSFTCGSHAAVSGGGDGGGGDRGPFADWSVDKQEAEVPGRGNSGRGEGGGGVRRGNGGIRGGGNGGIRGGGSRGDNNDEDDSDSDGEGGARWCPEESLVLLRNMSIARNVAGKGLTISKGGAAAAAAAAAVAVPATTRSGNVDGGNDVDLAFRTARGSSSSDSSTISNDSSSSGGDVGGGAVDDRIGRIRPPLGSRSRHRASRVLRAW